MSSHPIVSAEELACLLAPPASAQVRATTHTTRHEVLLANSAAALCLLKALVLYVAWQALHIDALPLGYLGGRGVLEVLCAAVFWSTLRQPPRRAITLGALLVGGTTLLMDLLMLLALPT